MNNDKLYEVMKKSEMEITDMLMELKEIAEERLDDYELRETLDQIDHTLTIADQILDLGYEDYSKNEKMANQIMTEFIEVTDIIKKLMQDC